MGLVATYLKEKGQRNQYKINSPNPSRPAIPSTVLELRTTRSMVDSPQLPPSTVCSALAWNLQVNNVTRYCHRTPVARFWAWECFSTEAGAYTCSICYLVLIFSGGFLMCIRSLSSLVASSYNTCSSWALDMGLGNSCCLGLPPDYVWVQGPDTGNYELLIHIWFGFI